jgi:hypothetical protein
MKCWVALAISNALPMHQTRNRRYDCNAAKTPWGAPRFARRYYVQGWLLNVRRHVKYPCKYLERRSWIFLIPKLP